MFGFQRIGDLIWAAGDMKCRGFLVGATSGRTTLSGEGLQHQDGHSHLLSYPYANICAYDTAFAYEVGIVVRDGIRRMYEEQEDVLFYLTVGNENYAQPELPDDRFEEIQQGVVRGIYQFRTAQVGKGKLRVQLLGSGALLNDVIRAQKILGEEYGVAAEIWSVTSYKELYRDALDAARWSVRHPLEEPRIPYVAQTLSNCSGPFVAVSDYVKALPESISRWIPGALISLGTDGFGRSDSRRELRDFFEVDYRHVVMASLAGLAREGKIDRKTVESAMRKMEIDPEKVNPFSL
jgi:pyruvate dehydrogenase E1 component